MALVTLDATPKITATLVSLQEDGLHADVQQTQVGLASGTKITAVITAPFALDASFPDSGVVWSSQVANAWAALGYALP